MPIRKPEFFGVPKSPEQNPESKREHESPAELHILYSPETEVNEVIETLERLSWYREHGYNMVRLPPEIAAMPDDESTGLRDDEILAIVQKNFDASRYAPKAQELQRRWQEMKGTFMQELASLGMPVQSAYDIQLTMYGVGGSYNPPNGVVVNISSEKRDILKTVAHEIIHLTINPLITEYNIEHWTKERLVDLVMWKIRGERRLQDDPMHAEEIERIFARNYPNITKIIEDVANLQPKNSQK